MSIGRLNTVSAGWMIFITELFISSSPTASITTAIVSEVRYSILP